METNEDLISQFHQGNTSLGLRSGKRNRVNRKGYPPELFSDHKFSDAGWIAVSRQNYQLDIIRKMFTV